MRKETGVDVGEAGVWVAVDRLAEARLLEQPLPEGGRSRREWLKQAAMVGGPHRRLHHGAAVRRSRDLRRRLHEPSQQPARKLRGDPLLPAGDGTVLRAGRRSVLYVPDAAGGCTA